jgi:hypothetical protein
MFFTLLGLVAAMLFGVFFGSEGELARFTQDLVFLSLIAAGAVLNALQNLYDKLCRYLIAIAFDVGVRPLTRATLATPPKSAFVRLEKYCGPSHRWVSDYQGNPPYRQLIV